MTTFAYDKYGRVFEEPPADMMWPVRCKFCGRVFDLTKVEAKARYADCTVFDHPCCGHKGGDDRPIGWGGTVERLERHSDRDASASGD